jgi:hypothetical protein
MWVWISCGVAVVVFATICGVAGLRAWRQVKALKASLVAVQHEVESYTDRMQVGASTTATADRPNVT